MSLHQTATHWVYELSETAGLSNVLKFRLEDDVYLYGVFDGHDGSKVANFASQRLPAEIVLDQLKGKTNDNEILQVLHQVCPIVDICTCIIDLGGGAALQTSMPYMCHVVLHFILD